MTVRQLVVLYLRMLSISYLKRDRRFRKQLTGQITERRAH
jgi:hypothetical protein